MIEREIEHFTVLEHDGFIFAARRCIPSRAPAWAN